MKRIWSFVICLALVLSLLPGAVFAAETDIYMAYAQIDAPAVDETVPYDAYYGADNNEGYELDAGNNNPNYYKNGIGWYDMTEGKNVSVGSRFQAGHQYKVMFYFSALEGYRFPEDLMIRINNEDALVHYISDSLVVGEQVFPRLPMNNPFTDVAEAHYFYAPVLWAVSEGVTTGTTATTFSPLNVCTRAQVVTFLWRAAGSPEPMKSSNPFTDVPENIYYYKAVLWAVENGITTGTSATTFSPESPCTRGQVVTFLHRAAGSPAPTSSVNPFSDVKDSLYYYNPILWAVEMGITNGTSATTFGPEETCIRAQIVTFLYRFYCRDLEIVSHPKSYRMTSSQELVYFDLEISGGSAPYTYRWYVSYDETEVLGDINTTDSTEYTFGWTFSDYDFDECGQILVYCEVTDANGDVVISDYAEVQEKSDFRLVSSPSNYQMTSSDELATFTVSVAGGKAPYSYHWFVYYDEEEVDCGAVVDNSTSNTLEWRFTDYDFDDHRDIFVRCVVSDSTGAYVETSRAYVVPKTNFALVSSPSHYYMSSSDEVAEFTVKVTGGAPDYTYHWLVCYDQEVVDCGYVKDDAPANTLEWRFTDYDFDETSNIYVYCEVFDSTGAKVTSQRAYVYQYVPLTLIGSPMDYQMEYSYEEIAFVVEVYGGIPAYTYEWIVVRDGVEEIVRTYVSDDTDDYLFYTFTDYDFDYCRTIEVYCIVTDENGDYVVSDVAQVFPKD